MDEATLARAMEPFYTAKGVGKGTGLGLCMVHGLAAQSGGRLVLRSQKGNGTTAEIWPPAVPRQAQAQPSPIHDQAAPGIGRFSKPLVILVVDDNALVLTNTAAMLEDCPASCPKLTFGPVRNVPWAPFRWVALSS